MKFDLDYGTLLSLFIGCLITWAVTYWYYKKAGSELLGESRKLEAAAKELDKRTKSIEDLVVLVAKGLSEAGLAEYESDDLGKPIKLKLHFKGVTAIGTGKAAGGLFELPDNKA